MLSSLVSKMQYFTLHNLVSMCPFGVSNCLNMQNAHFQWYCLQTRKGISPVCHDLGCFLFMFVCLWSFIVFHFIPIIMYSGHAVPCIPYSCHSAMHSCFLPSDIYVFLSCPMSVLQCLRHGNFQWLTVSGCSALLTSFASLHAFLIYILINSLS